MSLRAITADEPKCEKIPKNDCNVGEGRIAKEVAAYLNAALSKCADSTFQNVECDEDD